MSTIPPLGAVPDVISQTFIATDWGNAIGAASRGRVVQRFNTPAERDAAVPAPVAGMLCYVLSTDTAYLYRGGAWSPLSVKPATIRGVAPQGSTNHPAGVSTLLTITGIPALPVPYRLICRYFGRFGLANVAVTCDFDMRNGGTGGTQIIVPATKAGMWAQTAQFMDITVYGTQLLAANVAPVNVTLVCNPSAACWLEGVAEWEVSPT